MAEVPASSENWDITDLVIYARSGSLADEDVSDRVQRKLVNVRDFHIAKALLDGHAEKLSKKLPSQWGLVHLFDVCLTFGHVDTAMAMANHGVPGCEVELRHVDTLPRAGNRPGLFGGSDWTCKCRYWQKCQECCWGFPEEEGTWMQDWDLELKDAVSRAWQMAEQPWTRALLDFFSNDVELPCPVSPEAMARLLDIAILIGESGTAEAIARKCPCFPLRRWRAGEFVEFGREGRGEKPYHQNVLKAALLAGVNLGELCAHYHTFTDPFRKDLLETHPIPFEQALFLTSSSVWMECADFLPQKAWTAAEGNCLAGFFLKPSDDGENLTADLPMLRNLRKGGKTGIELTHLRTFLQTEQDPQGCVLSLLDCAILFRQPEAAALCCQAASFTRMTDMGRQVYSSVLDGSLRENLSILIMGSHVDFPLLRAGCLAAARAAGLALLRKNFVQHAKTSGFTIYQGMLTMCTSPFPSWLVKEILLYSMEVPLLIQQLNLWTEIAAWTV